MSPHGFPTITQIQRHISITRRRRRRTRNNNRITPGHLKEGGTDLTRRRESLSLRRRKSGWRGCDGWWRVVLAVRLIGWWRAMTVPLWATRHGDQKILFVGAKVSGFFIKGGPLAKHWERRGPTTVCTGQAYKGVGPPLFCMCSCASLSKTGPTAEHISVGSPWIHSFIEFSHPSIHSSHSSHSLFFSHESLRGRGIETPWASIPCYHLTTGCGPNLWSGRTGG